MPRVMIAGRSEEYAAERHGAEARLMPTMGEIERLCSFLDGFPYTKDQYWDSYEYWAKGDALEGDRWSIHSGLGGTYTMEAIMWYQHHRTPPCTRYRPSVILDALVRTALGIGEGSDG